MNKFRALLVVVVSTLSLNSQSFADHSTTVVVAPRTAAGRFFAPARVAARRGAAVALYNGLYNPYWATYPAASYYANNGQASFGYWGSSYGAYGSSYTQPGSFQSYHYGPYSTGSTYLSPTYRAHNGTYVDYARSPGNGFSISGPYNSFSLSRY